MNYDANEKFAAAKAAANLNDTETMRDLYNAAASKFYLERTELAFEDLEKHGWYANSEWSDWARDCTGEEWESIDDCIDCAEIAANNAVESDYIILRSGKHQNWKFAVNLMDDVIRETLHNELAPCSIYLFWDEYCKRHQAKFGEDFAEVVENA